MDFQSAFDKYKETALYGRYISLSSIESVLKTLKGDLRIISQSVLGNPIYASSFGTGTTKVLIWSQMHGNESTTTKALFDFLKFLQSDETVAKNFAKNFTFLCLPMLNPDGSEKYTRENANGIDLNRDACDLTQPESIALRMAFDDFKPDFCYNLHDQRTIYAVGNTNKPATISFLAPAYNFERETNSVRERAIHVIVAMNKELQKHIPGQVGRFDDAFNINCVGDTFQSRGVPTILFEAGHYQKDYNREQTRRFIFIALLSGLKSIHENVIVGNEIGDYLNIPQNKIAFYDIVYKNVKINYDSNKIITNFGLQFEEVLKDDKIVFLARFAEIGSLNHYSGHFESDAKGAEYSDDLDNKPEIGQLASFYLDQNLEIRNGAIELSVE